MTDDELQTLPLDEIERRCPSVSARRAAHRRLEELASARWAEEWARSGGKRADTDEVRAAEVRALQFMQDSVVGFARAIDALCALGEAVALVARATLLGATSLGKGIGSDTIGDAGALYGPGPRWLVYAAGSCEPTHEVYSPHPADGAARAVDLLIEEANR